MKFERVLTIYWSKGFLLNGLLKPFKTSFLQTLSSTGGYGFFIFKTIIKRFELFEGQQHKNVVFDHKNKYLRQAINLFLSQLSSVNNRVKEITKYSLIKLLLIKTSRGRSHALGKPSRGQRT